MKRTLTFVSFTVVFLMISSASNAGLINYQRREKNQGTAATTTQTKPSVTKSTSTQSSSQSTTQKASTATTNQVAKILKSNQKVVGYSESKYDLNADKVLQESEMKMLLTDVVASASKGDGYKVSSEFLKTFDADKDGYIDRYEAFMIKNNL